MAFVRNPAQRLKKLTSDDIIPIKDENGDWLVVTKQETTLVLREFIKAEMANHGNKLVADIVESETSRIEDILRDRLGEIEKSMHAFIAHKFDQLAETMCEKLLNKKFNEEIENRVSIKLEEHKIKKSGKGFK